MFEAYDIGMVERGHNIQFPIFEPSILEHFFDGDCLARIDHRRLINDTETAISNHALCGVGQTFLRTTRATGCSGGSGARLRGLRRRHNTQARGRRGARQ